MPLTIRSMVKVASSVIDDMLRRADALSQSARPREAYGVLREAARMAPRHAHVLAALGRISGELGDVAGGIEHLRKAVQIDGTKALYHSWLGALLQRVPDIENAEVSYKKALALKPDLPDAYGGLASIYERASRTAEAVALLEKGRKALPGDAQLEAYYWAIRSDAGDREAARDGLRAVLERRPEPNREALIRACHALGMTLDKLGDFDGAFGAFTRCNTLRAELGPVKEALKRDDFTDLTNSQRLITPEMTKRWREQEPDDGLPSPGLLIGFPRSGTTMTENVLAQHPRVAATPERPMLHEVTVEIQRMAAEAKAQLAAFMDALDAGTLTRLRRQYWESARKHADADLGPDFKARLLMDKFPLHLTRLGVINRVFPSARVIVALRDPRDCCLSAYTQLFGVNTAMVRFLTLEGTARLYELAMGLYLHLRPYLTVPTLQIRYEDTVEDLEAQCRRMLEFLGLEWNDSVLRPEDRAKKGYTNTPSYRAVTSAVNKKAKGRWPKYQKHLAPVFPILEPFIKDFGYEPSPAVGV